MKINKRKLVSFLLAVLMLMLASCGTDVSFGNETPGANTNGTQNGTNAGTSSQGGTNGQGNTSPNGEVQIGTINVESVVLNRTEYEMKYGATYLLIPTIRPLNASNATVTFTVDNPQVCEIEAGGNNICKVKAVGAGQAIVTANCQGRTATCRFTVSESIYIVEAEKIKIYGDVENIVVGSQREFTAVISPENVTDKTIAWFSSNPQIATVDENGVLTAIKEGKTVLSVSTADGKIQDKVDIYIVKTAVKPGVDSVTSVVLAEPNVTIRVGETFKIEATAMPLTAPERGIWYVNETKDLITVDKNGLVTGVKPGSARVTVGSQDGKRNVCTTCRVTVLPAE